MSATIRSKYFGYVVTNIRPHQLNSGPNTGKFAIFGDCARGSVRLQKSPFGTNRYWWTVGKRGFVVFDDERSAQDFLNSAQTQ